LRQENLSWIASHERRAVLTVGVRCRLKEGDSYPLIHTKQHEGSTRFVFLHVN
jgi:hypothetical protein